MHAHAQNEPIKNYYVSTTPLASMCRAMPFSARALKENIFFDHDIAVKKHNREVKHDVYGKRQTAKMKLLRLYSAPCTVESKHLILHLNSKRHFSIFV